MEDLSGSGCWMEHQQRAVYGISKGGFEFEIACQLWCHWQPGCYQYSIPLFIHLSVEFIDVTIPVWKYFYNTFRPQPYDANIKWETTTQIDVGVDFGLFRDRITGTVDFYKKDTEDLINSIPVPGGSNFSNFLLTNVGNLVNKGVEVTINTVPIKNEKFEWNFGFNFTYNENEVTKLLKTEDPNYPGVQVGGIGLQRYIQNIQVGYPVNTFLVFKQVYDDQGAPVEGLYVDKTGPGGDVTANENNKFRYQKPQAGLFDWD